MPDADVAERVDDAFIGENVVGGDEVFDQFGERGHGGVSPLTILKIQNDSWVFGTATVSTRGKPGWWP